MAKRHSTVWLNPPFDEKMLAVGLPWQKKLERGRIRMSTKPYYGAKFLYNPMTVQVTHPLQNVATSDPDTLGNVGRKVRENTSQGIMAGGGSVAVTVIYDRTYEVWQGKGANPLAFRYGAYADVMALYDIYGITQSYDDQNGNLFRQVFPSSPASMRSVYLYIGDKLKFYGVTSDLTVNYTHFSSDMIPLRCEVEIKVDFMVGEGLNKEIETSQWLYDNP